ncbi:unnamed protein product, partial [Prorocentrum cordatum]
DGLRGAARGGCSLLGSGMGNWLDPVSRRRCWPWILAVAAARGLLARSGKRPDGGGSVVGLRLLHARREDQRAHLDGTGNLSGERDAPAATAVPGRAPHHVRRRAGERGRDRLHLGGLPRRRRLDHRLRRARHLHEGADERGGPRRPEGVAAERLRAGLAVRPGIHPPPGRSDRRRSARVRAAYGRGRAGAGCAAPGPPGRHGADLLRVQRRRLPAARAPGRGLVGGREPGQARRRDRLGRGRPADAADVARGGGLRGRARGLGSVLLRQGEGVGAAGRTWRTLARQRLREA